VEQRNFSVEERIQKLNSRVCIWMFSHIFGNFICSMLRNCIHALRGEAFLRRLRGMFLLSWAYETCRSIPLKCVLERHLNNTHSLITEIILPPLAWNIALFSFKISLLLNSPLLPDEVLFWWTCITFTTMIASLVMAEIVYSYAWENEHKERMPHCDEHWSWRGGFILALNLAYPLLLPLLVSRSNQDVCHQDADGSVTRRRSAWAAYQSTSCLFCRNDFKLSVSTSVSRHFN